MVIGRFIKLITCCFLCLCVLSEIFESTQECGECVSGDWHPSRGRDFLHGAVDIEHPWAFLGRAAEAAGDLGQQSESGRCLYWCGKDGYLRGKIVHFVTFL